MRLMMKSSSRMMMSCRTIRNSWQQKAKSQKAKKATPKEDEEEQEEQEMQTQLFEVVSIQAAAGGMIFCIVGFGVIFSVLRFRRGFSTSFSEPLFVNKV